MTFQAARGLFRDRGAAVLAPGSLARRFATGVFWSLAAAVVSRGFNLAASIFCARLLGQERFGEYGMIQSTVGTLGTFSVLGLGLTATRYVAEYRDRDPARVARILRMSSMLSLVSGATLAVLLVITAPAVAARILAAPRLAVPLAVGASTVLLNAVVAFQNGAIAGFEAFRALARVNLVSGVASFAFISFGAWCGGVSGGVIGWAVSVALQAALNSVVLRAERERARIPAASGSWRAESSVFWRFSVPAFLASFVVAPALWACDALLANRPEGYLQLGLYTAADRWRAALLFVPTTVMRMVLPLLSNLKGNAQHASYRRVHRVNVFLNLGLVAVPAVALVVLARVIMSSYGPGFRAGSAALAVLAVGTIPEALNTVLGYPLVLAHQMWTRFTFDLLLGTVLVALGVVLIPRWGAMGLAIAYVAAFTVTSAGLYGYTARRTRPASDLATGGAAGGPAA